MEIDPNALMLGGMTLARAARLTVMPVAGERGLPFMYVKPRTGDCIAHSLARGADDEVERRAQEFAKANLKGTLGCAMAMLRKLPTEIGAIDAFLVDVWYPEYGSVTRLLQPFQSIGGKKGFSLLGPLIIAIDRVPLPARDQGLFAPLVMAGLDEDDEVAAIWSV